MPTWKVIHGTLEDFLEEDHGLFHFLFSDWPYNLEAQVKRFGKKGSKLPQGGVYARKARGFMNQTWDGTDIAYQPQVWEKILRHLHPGAFTAGFTHPRKQDMLAHAQRQAGYLMGSAFYNYHSGQIIQVPHQLGWIYGSGKQVGTRLDAIIDSQAGVKRGKKRIKTTGTMQNFGGGNRRPWMDRAAEAGYHEVDDDTPVTPLAQSWVGWQYGQPLAPEIEPIIVAQKPYEGKPVSSITRTGAGAVNVKFGQSWNPGERFPGNLILTHHPDCTLRGMKLIKNGNGSVTGDEPSEAGKNTYGQPSPRMPYEAKGQDGYEEVPDYICHPDCTIPQMEAQAGSPKAHYFFQADWSFEVAERIALANPVFYSGKVDPKERNLGCWDMPLVERQRVNPGGLQNEPRFANTFQYNPHPTLKPIKLCAWIAGLFLPPESYAPRRVIVPCSGTGSEMAGCLLAGWDEVIGIEMQPADEDSPDYSGIAVARLTEIEKWISWGQANIDSIVKAAYETAEVERVDQLTMF